MAVSGGKRSSPVGVEAGNLIGTAVATSAANRPKGATAAVATIVMPEARRGLRGDVAALYKEHGHVLVGLVGVLVAIGAWQLTGLFMNPIFISTPSAVFRALVHIIATGALPSAFLRSLLEMLGGLVAATFVGVGIGLLMGRVRLVEKALDPLVALGNATPTIALLPVMEVWFGFGTTARVAFIMVIAVWPILVNTYAGVRTARSRLTDVGKAFGLNPWRQTWKIYFPASMPYILVGMRISLAVGAVGMILGGQEVGQAGLGGLTEVYAEYSQTSDLVAAIITTTGLAMLMFLGLRILRSRAFPWIAATSAGRRR